jgi:predicted phosphoribosyltransferase
MLPTLFFKDRADAASQLADRLHPYQGHHPLVLAIPRGAVPMAKTIAERLQGELDVVLSRKIPAPYSPEYAIGAIDENGWVYLSEDVPMMNLAPDYIEREKNEQLKAIRKRRAQYTPLKKAIDPKDRVVIVVDDGLATGATMIAALHALREKKPARLICAVPVAAPDSLEKVRALADEVVCLHAPPYFRAVGQFYQHFAQVDDAEVETLLRAS